MIENIINKNRNRLKEVHKCVTLQRRDSFSHIIKLLCGHHALTPSETLGSFCVFGKSLCLKDNNVFEYIYKKVETVVIWARSQSNNFRFCFLVRAFFSGVLDP